MTTYRQTCDILIYVNSIRFSECSHKDSILLGISFKKDLSRDSYRIKYNRLSKIHCKQWKNPKGYYGPYWSMSGNEPSTLTLYKLANILQILQFHKFTQEKSESKTHPSTGSND